ncbi:ATP-dependent helicase [Patescibacteria group bacterium]
MDVLKGLNEQQCKAVMNTKGPLLVLAGAGSGKTKVIAHRIAQIIKEGTNPSKILAVTFTNKAAEEMRERIARLIGEKDVSPFIGTFHSLGVHILRRHGNIIDIPKSFTILDKDDSLKILKELTRELELDPEIYSPERIRESISRLKNELIDVALFAKEAMDSSYETTLGKIYAAYEARLLKTKSLDFDDLLLKPLMILESKPDALKFWQDRWHYIHIDEYQDTNQAQYKLSYLLAALHQNIAVVGDIDQAIYSWRGADWRNILNFEKDFKNARVVSLEKNYRSTKRILEAAGSVIANNSERKELKLYTNNPEGELINIDLLEDEKIEAKNIVYQIKRLLKKGCTAKDIAILFRTNAQSRAIEEALLKAALPYKLVAGVKFYERKEIKDVLAYIKYAINPSDLFSLKRIINTPPRGIGKTLQIKYIGQKELSDKETLKIKNFEAIIEKIKKIIKTKKARDVILMIIKEAGFENYLSHSKEGLERLKNIKELLSVAKKFKELDPEESTEKFLEEVSLMSDQDMIEDKSEKIHLITAHAAKGLEFKIIIITGMEEGLFPHSLAQEEGLLEEERRLFYVAITRAKEKVIITLTKKRTLCGELSFNTPSRFLKEIPECTVSNPIKLEEYEEEQEIIY